MENFSRSRCRGPGSRRRPQHGTGAGGGGRERHRAAGSDPGHCGLSPESHLARDPGAARARTRPRTSRIRPRIKPLAIPARPMVVTASTSSGRSRGPRSANRATPRSPLLSQASPVNTRPESTRASPPTRLVSSNRAPRRPRPRRGPRRHPRVRRRRATTTGRPRPGPPRARPRTPARRASTQFGAGRSHQCRRTETESGAEGVGGRPDDQVGCERQLQGEESDVAGQPGIEALRPDARCGRGAGPRETTRAPAPVTTITSWAATTARGTDLDQAGQRSSGR